MPIPIAPIFIPNTKRGRKKTVQTVYAVSDEDLEQALYTRIVQNTPLYLCVLRYEVCPLRPSFLHSARC